MNAIQFGRWLGERRHACGWASQRALADAAQHHPYTAGLHVSEAFLARLEAGLLAHPFRGAVRERVLALGWLVCKTPRQVRAYVAAAGLTDLTSDEQQRVMALRRALGAPQTPPPVRLPRRVPFLMGRQHEMAELAHLLSTLDSGWVAVTGMAGIGKSALAADVLHLLSAAPADRCAFPDGIVTFDCSGRIGAVGLQSLLDDVAVVYERCDKAPASRSAAVDGDAGHRDGAIATSCAVARATDRVRSALHGRRTLVLLDGVDPRFPLTSALEALLASDPRRAEESRPPALCRGRVVLVTSRYLPRGSQLAGHVALRPLDSAAAVELLEHTAGRRFAGSEREVAIRLCEVAGGVPLAIEEVATSLAVARLPLCPRTDPLLAVRLLDRQAGGDGICERLSAAIGVLDGEARQELRRLAASTAPDKGPRRQWHVTGDDQHTGPVAVQGVVDRTRAKDVGLGRADSGEWAVAAIAQLVRHSLVEPLGDPLGMTGAIESRFALNPLVRALVLSGDMDETHVPDPVVSDVPQDDAVRFLRRGGSGRTALGGLRSTARQRAGGQ